MKFLFWRTFACAALLLVVSAIAGRAQNINLTVYPGASIYVQNLSGSPWYFYSAPNQGTATMTRMDEARSAGYPWGSFLFRQDLTGANCRVNPREFLVIYGGNNPSGSTINVNYYLDSTFSTAYTMAIKVQNESATILGITRLDQSPTSANSVRWEVELDRPVAGLLKTNFALQYSSGTTPNPTISNLAPSAGSGFRKWTLTADTGGRTSGTISLRWVGGDIESPPVFAVANGPAYTFAPLVFKVRQFGKINIENVTDDVWYFDAPATPASATMSRVNEDGSVDLWGSANFGPDITAQKNRILRHQFLRVEANGTAIGTTIAVNYYLSQQAQRSISILVDNGAAQVTSITRLDPSPTTQNTIRWEVLFDQSVAGVKPANFTFRNYAVAGISISSVVPDATSGFRKWTVTAALDGSGNGPIALCWNLYGFGGSESPAATNSLVGESYEYNPLVFSVAPGTQIDIENVIASRLYFRAAPTPTTAQMFRVGQSTIPVEPWGGSSFTDQGGLNAHNWIPFGQWLRIDAGTTPVGTPIIVRAYRQTYSDDTGFEIRVNVQVPDAQVLSLNILDPSPTVADSVRWEATFNKAVAGVTAANFAFINSAQITPTPTITSVVASPGGNNVRWTITANTAGTGVGLLGLRYIGHRAEIPAAMNTFTGQSYDFSSYPIIKQEPAPLSAILVTGATAPTLTIVATIRSADPLLYQWKKGSSQTPNQAVDIPGATTPIFTPPTNVPGHWGYFCHVFTLNPNTGEPSGYYANTLTSVMNVYTPAAIVAQPATVAIPSNGTATFTVGATGTELQYQWYEGTAGDKTKPVAGATSATFTTPELTQNKSYWVLAGNALGASYDVQSVTVTARVIRGIQLATNSFTPQIMETISNMTARAIDSDGNPTPGATITFEIQSAGYVGGASAGGNFTSGVYAGGQLRATTTTGSDGWTTSPGMWTNTRAGTYQVLALSEGPRGLRVSASMTIQNQPGPLGALTWLAQPSAQAVAGQPFATQPSVGLTDLWGNSVAATTTVTASVDQGLGSLQGITSVQSVNGVATFTNLSYHVAEKIRLILTAAGANSRSNDIVVGAAAGTLLTAAAGTPQGTAPGQDFATALTAKLTDTYGNVVSGKSISFDAPASGASATFRNGQTFTTDDHGQVFALVRANNVAGTYTLTTSASGVASGQTASFQLSNFNALQAWRAANFAGQWQSIGNAANDAIPFAEGVPNLLKYAFNLNAQSRDCTLMTAQGSKGLPLVGMDGQGRLTVTFVRRKAAALPAINYTVQFSSGLTSNSFAVNPNAITSAPTSIDATWERVTVTDSIAQSPSNPQRFVRLQISEQ